MPGLTIDNPVTLTQALASYRIIPGDTLELADGIYTGDFVVSPTLIGTYIKPIIIKPRNPGMVTINGSFTVNGQHVHIYDLNFMDNRTDQYTATPAIYCAEMGFGLHGCIVNGLHNSGVQWFSGGDSEVSENMILNCGDYFADGSGHGHSIYTHNNPGGEHRILRNMFGNNRGDYTIHIYSGGGNALRDYVVENNVIHGDSVHCGGGLGLFNFVYRNNIQYSDYAQFGRYAGLNQNDTALIEGNESIDIGSWVVRSDNSLEWLNLTEQNNIFYGAAWPAGTYNQAGYTLAAKPQTKVWLNQFTKSARWLGNVIIFNRDSAASVAVDFSSVLSAGSYLLRNAGNPAETWAFEYAGSGTVDVPMNWTTIPGAGVQWPVFGSCVIEN